MDYREFIKYLKSIKDEKYKKFNERIIRTNYEMLGIKLPVLKSISKEIIKGDYKNFLKICKSIYYEEVMIYLLIISSLKDINELNKYFYKALDLIDNWALCDTFCGNLKIVKNNKEYFLNIINSLVNSNKTYYIRVGFVLILNYYVEEKYLKIIFEYLDNIKSEEYYVNMAKSWLLCEVFIKYQNNTLEYLKYNKLDKFTINKAISKIRDSYRVEKDIKDKILKYKRN